MILLSYLLWLVGGLMFLTLAVRVGRRALSLRFNPSVGVLFPRRRGILALSFAAAGVGLVAVALTQLSHLSGGRDDAAWVAAGVVGVVWTLARGWLRAVKPLRWRRWALALAGVLLAAWVCRDGTWASEDLFLVAGWVAWVTAWAWQRWRRLSAGKEGLPHG